MPDDLRAVPETVDTYYENVRREITSLLPTSCETVLEIGCGAGATMRWLRSIRSVRYAAGVELWPEAAQIARTVFDAVEVADINAARFDFAQDRFDLILALDVLEHLTDPQSVVRRLKEKLKPGGLFIASIPNVTHFSVALPLLLRGRWEYKDSGLLDRTHLRFFNRRSAAGLFTEAGYKVVRMDQVRRGPNLFGLLSHQNRAVRWYAERALSAIFRWPRHWFDFQFLIAARPE